MTQVQPNNVECVATRRAHARAGIVGARRRTMLAASMLLADLRSRFLDRSDIDIEKLRQKYSRPRSELQAEAQAKYGDGGDIFSKHEDNMTQVIMCQACQAHGTVKRQYGYRVLDEVCENCNGEGCFVQGQGKKASLELKESVKKVEELIANCEDLEELEKLEEALKQRTPAAIEAVLKEYRMKVIADREAAEAADVAAADNGGAAAAADVTPPPPAP